MSNGAMNCRLGVCCPPEQQEASLREGLQKAFSDDDGNSAEWYARVAAKFIMQNFDLAPAGTLTAFKAEIAKLARENP